MILPTREALAELEARVERALSASDDRELRVLGYGEISTVLHLEEHGQAFACKRLPLFPNRAALDDYRACLTDYLEALGQRGVHVVPTALLDVARPDGRWAAYAVQPELAPDSFMPAILARSDEPEGRAVFRELVEVVFGAVGPRLGIDGQASNWVRAEGQLRYLDVTTPMLRDDSGAERLDLELFIASLPWALRGPVKRMYLSQILDKYYVPRGVVLDALANLMKEGLGRWLPALIEVANERVQPALTQDEVRRYYASDARMWALLQRLRRIDRAWQRGIRRRIYPFLLPGRIERHV